MMAVWFRSIVCLVCTCLWAGSLGAAPPDSTAADLLPESTVVYMEGSGTEALLNLPLVKSLKATDLFRQVWRSPEVMKVRGGITIAEVALGERLTDTLARATSGGWVLAIDAQTQGAVLMAETADKSTCADLYAKLEAIASQDAKSNNREFEQVTYREVPAYKIGDAIVAAVDKYLVVTNKSDLGKALADNLASPTKRSLGAQSQFTSARSQQRDSNANVKDPLLLWTYVNLEHIRSQGLAKELFKRPDDNFAAELLLGGVLSVLRHTSTLTGSLRASDDQLKLELSTPTPKAVKASDYEFFFGKDLSGSAPPPLQLEQPHATLTAYRDVSKLWRHAGDLFGQTVNDQLAQADATLTTLFSGRDFGEEILGAIEPGSQIVVAANENRFAYDAEPKIKLPAFALVSTLKDADKMRPQLKRIFFSLIGFLNIAGAQEQQPQLDVDILNNEAGVLVVTSKFVMDADRPSDWVVPVQYNFSPTLVVWDNAAILSSNQLLAEQIVGKLQSNRSAASPTSTSATTSPAKGSTNTHLHIDGPMVSQAMSINRDELISQNMLEKGHTQDEATTEIDQLLAILDLFKALDVRLDVSEQTMLKIDLGLRTLNP